MLLAAHNRASTLPQESFRKQVNIIRAFNKGTLHDGTPFFPTSRPASQVPCANFNSELNSIVLFRVSWSHTLAHESNATAFRGNLGISLTLETRTSCTPFASGFDVDPAAGSGCPRRNELIRPLHERVFKNVGALDGHGVVCWLVYKHDAETFEGKTSTKKTPSPGSQNQLQRRGKQM